MNVFQHKINNNFEILTIVVTSIKGNIPLYLLIFISVSGKFMSKMCSNIPVQDCQVANSVEYCYCRGELCNKQQSQQSQSNQVPKATRRPAPAPDTPTSTKAPKAPSRPRDSDKAEVHRAHDLHQLSTLGPEESPPAAGAAGLQGIGRLAAAAALALLVCRHILTPNIA